MNREETINQYVVEKIKSGCCYWIALDLAVKWTKMGLLKENV